MVEEKVEAPARLWLRKMEVSGHPAWLQTSGHDSDDVEYISVKEANRLEHKACPCLHTEPCQKRCTCVMGHSSHGCAFCCSYGSQEQQQVRAEHLRSLILLGLEVEADRVHNTRQRAERAARAWLTQTGLLTTDEFNQGVQQLAGIIAAEFEK